MNGELNEVALISEELSRAVELTLNPCVSQDARLQAYNACESFKENSPWCAQAGLLLASGQYSAVVKHFGLQLMEHTVKYRWTQISQEEKIFIKENAMKLLIMGGWELCHLNDALARVIVEMIKREWPQQWPTLLAELSDACARGHVHTQIVLHVFLRLVEDVATLQTLEQHQRRKDIYQALTSNMAEIFAFFMRLIELHVQEFREKTAAGDFNAAASNERVVQVVLLTLTGFVEWVSTNHVVMNNGRLLQILCILLQDDAFRLPAAECLLQVVNRKGSTKERKPLLILFSEDAISCIHRAAVAAINVVDDKNYLFLKKLSQVLVGLSQQLTSLWAFATTVELWMPVLLETLLVLTTHPSLSLAHTVNSVWLSFFKHDHISKLPHLLAVVPRWLQTMAPKVLKVSYPSTRSTSGVSDAVSFACIDYDSEHEFSTFFSRCRTEILESFRHCMTTAPLVTWSYVEQWSNCAIEKVHSCEEDIDMTHPVYVEWEALSMVLDVVLSKLLSCEPRPDVSQGLQLLSRCVCTEPKSPLLLSLLLSFMSALFVFLSCAYSQLAGPTVGNAGAELLPRVLDKIFASLVYEGTATDDRKCRNVKNVRRHAASLLVKLGSKYPLLLLGVLGRIHMWARAALRERGLSSLEAVALQEALLLVANHLCCYEKQSAIIAEILSECSSQWAELSQVTCSVRSFALGVGLHSDDCDAQPALGLRQQLLHYTALLLGVVKRSCVPDDPDKASRGGFSLGQTPSGNPIWRNPCSVHVLPLVPHVLSLVRAMHELNCPQHFQLRHSSHSKAMDMPLAEQHTLLGRRDSDSTHAKPQDKMQTFIHTLHDNVCHLIGSAASSLGRELYSVPGLATALSGSLLHSLPYLPDHWLKQIVRSALKPLLHHCVPSHLNDVAVPLMEIFAPFMLNHLNNRWEYINSLYESGKLEEESTESQEVLEDMIVRNLTREHVEVLKICLVGGPLNLENSSGDMEEDSSPPQRTPEQISELGTILLNNTTTGPAVFQTLLVCVMCNDSVSSLRACVVLSAMVRSLRSCVWFDASMASHTLLASLRGLTAHGQHDANQAALLHAAIQIYEALRPQYPAMLGVLRAIPDVDAHDLNRLDEKVCNNTNKPPKVDKSKRDLFKKITAKLIGRNVGQLFKKEVLIRDLPHMNATPKEKPRSAMDTPEGAALDKLFNGPNT